MYIKTIYQYIYCKMSCLNLRLPLRAIEVDLMFLLHIKSEIKSSAKVKSYTSEKHKNNGSNGFTIVHVTR